MCKSLEGKQSPVYSRKRGKLNSTYCKGAGKGLELKNSHLERRSGAKLCKPTTRHLEFT